MSPPAGRLFDAVAAGEFEAFWKAYPRKVGKLAAAKAYAVARKQATAEQLLAGIALYRQTKPAYADWCHPMTWLNQGRWLDEVASAPASWVCPHTPHCNGRNACRVLQELGR